MDRKLVKPAQEGGRIWNPDHAGFVPLGGIEVTMTPYWIALEQRADIVTSDPVPDPTATAPTDPALVVPPATQPIKPVQAKA